MHWCLPQIVVPPLISPNSVFWAGCVLPPELSYNAIYRFKFVLLRVSIPVATLVSSLQSVDSQEHRNLNARTFLGCHCRLQGLGVLGSSCE